MSAQGKIWIIFDAVAKRQTKPLSLAQTQTALMNISPNDYHKFFLWTPGWNEWISVKNFFQSEQQFFQVITPPNPMNIVIKDPPETKSSISTRDGTKTAITRTFPDEFTQTHTSFENPYTEVLVGETKTPDPTEHFYQEDFNGHDLDLNKIQKNVLKKSPIRTTKKSSSSNTAKSGIDRRQQPRHNFKIEILLVSPLATFKSYSKNISTNGTLLEDEIPKEFVGRQFDMVIINPFEKNPKKSRLLFKAKIVGDIVDRRRLKFFEAQPTMQEQLEALLQAYLTYQKTIKDGAA